MKSICQLKFFVLLLLLFTINHFSLQFHSLIISMVITIVMIITTSFIITVNFIFYQLTLFYFLVIFIFYEIFREFPFFTFWFTRFFSALSRIYLLYVFLVLLLIPPSLNWILSQFYILLECFQFLTLSLFLFVSLSCSVSLHIYTFFGFLFFVFFFVVHQPPRMSFLRNAVDVLTPSPWPAAAECVR